MLGNLHYVLFIIQSDSKCLSDFRQLPRLKRNVDNRPGYLYYFSCHVSRVPPLNYFFFITFISHALCAGGNFGNLLCNCALAHMIILHRKLI